MTTSFIPLGIYIEFATPQAAQRATYAQAGRKIVSAHLEQAGAVLSKDPDFHHDAKCLGRDFGKRKAKHGKASTLRHSLDAILNAKGKAAREQAITNARWLLSVNDGKRAMAEAAD